MKVVLPVSTMDWGGEVCHRSAPCCPGSPSQFCLLKQVAWVSPSLEAISSAPKTCKTSSSCKRARPASISDRRSLRSLGLSEAGLGAHVDASLEQWLTSLTQKPSTCERRSR